MDETNNVTPVTPPSTPSMTVNNNPHHSVIKTILLSIVAIVVLAGVAYGAYWGITQSSQPKVTLGQAVVNTLDGIRSSKIKTVNFEGTISGTAKNSLTASSSSSSATSPQDQQLADLKNVKFSASVSGSIDDTTPEDFKMYGKINTQAKVDATSGSAIALATGLGPIELNFEFYLFTDAVYFRINTLPSALNMTGAMFGITPSDYVNKWYVYKDSKNIGLFVLGLHSLKGYVSDSDFVKLSDAIEKFYDRGNAFKVTSSAHMQNSAGDDVTELTYNVNFDQKAYNDGIAFLREVKAIFPTQLEKFDIDKLVADMEKNPLQSKNITGMKVSIGSDGYIVGNSGHVSDYHDLNGFDYTEDMKSSLKYNTPTSIVRPEGAVDIMTVVAEIQGKLAKFQKSMSK